MEDIIGEIGKGFLRALGYLLFEVFFKTICFGIGWPVCKIVTFGKYPIHQRKNYWADHSTSNIMCSLVGLSIFLVVGGYILNNWA